MTEVGPRLVLVLVLGGAFGVDLADLLEGAGQGVKVSRVLVASLPQVQYDRRRTPLLCKIRQVPAGGAHKAGLTLTCNVLADAFILLMK